MTNKSRFRVCRGCLVSSDVADLINIFEESGETLRKFQEISGIDISQDKHKYFALICRPCLEKIEISFKIAVKIRNIEKFYISTIREADEARKETQIFSEDELQEPLRDEKVEEEQEFQNFDALTMEAEDDVLAPMALFTEFTIEEFNELNLKVPVLNVEKMKMSAAEEKFEKRSQSHSVRSTRKNEENLKRALLTRINIQKKKPASNPAAMTPNHCKICFKMFSRRTNLKMHIQMVHEKKRNFTCDLCLKKSCHKGNLRKHMINHVFNNDDTTNANRPHRCDFDGCKSFFKLKHHLNRHKKIVHVKN